MRARTLLVVRHAKSAWDTDAPTDHARPLNHRGRADAPAMGAALAHRGWRPDLVLCSDAVRALQTWGAMQQAFEVPPPVRLQRRLYHAGTSAVRDLCQGLSVDLQTVAVIGHNPGWEELVEELSGLKVRVTSGNVIRLEGDGRSWPDALARPWRVAAVLRPKELSDGAGG